MSRHAKILIGILGLLFVMCICIAIGGYIVATRAGEALESSFITEPDEVAQVAEKIIDYELPEAYSEQFGMSFFGFDLVAFGSTGEDDKPLIMLMQFPQNAGLSQEEMQKQMSQAMARQNQAQPFDLKQVEQRNATIRSQEVILTVNEGRHDEGATIRQLSGLFDGKNGTVFLMITGSVERWDEVAIDEFLSSIR